MAASGFRPPPYPYERLNELRLVADAVAGGVVDCSIGTPCDPVPAAVVAAGSAAMSDAAGYPPSVGSVEFRRAVADWVGRRLRASIDLDQVAACVGTKEFVASLPHLLRLRDPSRDTVLYPAISYPTYEMGATLGGCRAVPVALDDEWHLDLDSIAGSDVERALLLWVNEPGNPTSSVVDSDWFERAAVWGREHGVVVASDECYAEFAPTPASVLSAGPSRVLAVHSLSKRSNFAGARVGFYAGDRELVSYLGEVRKHAGLIVATAMQASAAVALTDDEDATHQRETYEARRDLVIEALGALGYRHVGGPTPFYLWLRADDGGDGWEVTRRFARAGTLIAPGDLYGSSGRGHARLALVQPTHRLELAVERLAKELS